MDENEVQDVELTGAGKRTQQITMAAAGVLGVLLKVGIIGAGSANPALAGVAILSSLLPSLFQKKKKAAAPQAQSLLGGPPMMLEPAPPQGSKLAAVGMILLQLAAVLTALASWANALPGLPFVSEDARAYITLGAAAVAAITPGLQKVGTLLQGGAS